MNPQVVIAGAGPTGLLLATELALAGVDVMVLDARTGRSGQSKALSLQPRSAEILASRGLLEPLLDSAGDLIPAGHFAGLSLDYQGLDTLYPYQIGTPQARVEDLLERVLAERGVKVQYASAVTGFEQDADGVSIEVDGRLEPVRADWLVGCDGGRSTVRRVLAVPFDGRDPRMSGVVADVTFAAADGAPTGWELPSLTPVDGVVTTVHPLGDGVFRMLTAGPEQQTLDRDTPVTPDELARALATGYRGTLRLSTVHWASRFSDVTRQARQYRTGRVLLAGDAAHVHSPTGGQGLNLGLQDAFNLGWKLAATVRGTAPQGLLDSYHAERHPVAARVLAGTLAQGVLLVPDGDVAALRDVVADLLVLPAANQRLAGLMSGLDIRYRVGSAHPVAGSRMPDVDLEVDGDATTSSRLLRNGQGFLLRSNGVVTAGAAAALVRPDGYVAWAAGPGERDEPGLAAAIARWFGAGPVREVFVGAPPGQ